MKWIKKSKDFSLAEYGKYPGSRSIDELKKNGFIVLDKISGPTSHQVDNWIKELVGVKKVSHAGTLDPRTTGVLIIALENANKLMQILYNFITFS